MPDRNLSAVIPKFMKANDSASLWNYTLSPGWTSEESEILRRALLKFGIGNWYMIAEAGCLPGKTLAQMNLQAQRMLGQQSTAEFQGLHIDVLEIGQMNAMKTGVKRKNGFIVNTGKKANREELKRRWDYNKEHYEKRKDEVEGISLPRPMTASKLIESKETRLMEVEARLQLVEEMIWKRKEELWREGKVGKEALEGAQLVEEFPGEWREEGKPSVFEHMGHDGRVVRRKPAIALGDVELVHTAPAPASPYA